MIILEVRSVKHYRFGHIDLRFSFRNKGWNFSRVKLTWINFFIWVSKSYFRLDGQKWNYSPQFIDQCSTITIYRMFNFGVFADLKKISKRSRNSFGLFVSKKKQQRALKTCKGLYELLKIIKDTINPSQLFIEKRQFLNQNNQWLNNIINH